MVKMPEDIKQKLRELDILCRQANTLESQLEFIFLSYGINPNVLRGVGNIDVQTEAFADIVNCSGDIEKNIREIEIVFLHYARRNENE